MATTIDIAVPDIGEYHDIPVIAILVKAGDTIAKDAPLVELESEKATMEVPSSAAGIVRAINVKLGDKVSQGSVLASLEIEDAAVPATVASSAPKAAPVTLPVPVAAPASQPTHETTVLANVGDVAPSSYGAPGTNGTSNGVSIGTSHASPAIRRFARELGVTIGGVRGSGPNGRITREDVQGFVKSALSSSTASATASAGNGSLGFTLPAWPVVDFAKFGPIERKPLSRIQKISGPILHRNWVRIPHVTQNDEADVTELEAFRKQLNLEHKDVKVTMLALLMKAVVTTLKAFPIVNSSLDGDDLILKQYYHIGFAADTPNGLVVPVIKDADKKGILAIARETSELAAKARDGKIGPSDMQGATFTISSLGGIGGTSFTPIINAPEVAILGVVRSAVKPVWDGTTFVPRTMLPLSLSYDHRVIDGAAAARFCASLATTLGDLRRTLL